MEHRVVLTFIGIVFILTYIITEPTINCALIHRFCRFIQKLYADNGSGIIMIHRVCTYKRSSSHVSLLLKLMQLRKSYEYSNKIYLIFLHDSLNRKSLQAYTSIQTVSDHTHVFGQAWFFDDVSSCERLQLLCEHIHMNNKDQDKTVTDLYVESYRQYMKQWNRYQTQN